MDLSIHAHHI